MHNIQRTLLSAALLAGALSLSPYAANQAAQHDEGLPPHSQLFPTPQHGLLIRGGKEGQSLEEIVAEFEKVTGEHVMFSRDTAAVLKHTTSGLIGDLEVAPGDVYSVVQDIMITNRFVFIDTRREEPRMLSIASLDSPARASIKEGARFVPEERLGEFALDSAFLITTVIDLPNIDWRTAGSAIRAIVIDPNTQTLIPLAESNQAILTGFGNRVNNLVHLLRRIDEVSARATDRDREEELHQALLKAAKRMGLDDD